MIAKRLCKNCKHLETDGMFGIFCGVGGDNTKYDCSKYERKEVRRMTKKNNFKTTIERDVVTSKNQMFLDELNGIPHDEAVKRNMHYKSPTFSIKMEDDTIPVMYFLTFEDMQIVCKLLETKHMRFGSCGRKK